jgi:uncharacterized protein
MVFPRDNVEITPVVFECCERFLGKFHPKWIVVFMPAKYQVYKDSKGKYRFRFRAGNGRIVAVGEGYEQHASCLKGIKSIQNNCSSEIEDLTIESKKIPNPKYQIYYDEQNKFRFRLKAKNGEIIAQGEGYEAKEGCLNGIDALRNGCDAEIEDSTIIPESTEAIVSSDVTSETKAAEAAELKVVELKAAEAAELKVVELKAAEAAELKVVELKAAEAKGKEFIQTEVGSSADMSMSSDVGPAETILELHNPSAVSKGEAVSFQGRLYRSDTGKGIPGAKIRIYERDKSLFGDDFLAYGDTAEDGSFNINWKARSLAWRKDSGNIYAQFKGNEKAKSSKSTVNAITIK